MSSGFSNGCEEESFAEMNFLRVCTELKCGGIKMGLASAHVTLLGRPFRVARPRWKDEFCLARTPIDT
jgi:hypothetical protein